MRESNRNATPSDSGRAFRLAVLMACSVGLAGCANLQETLTTVWELPNSHARAEKKASAEGAEARAEGAAAAARSCEERVVYKHHFSERVVVESAERNAKVARITQLEHEVQRLNSDLAQAEQALIAAEGSLKAAYTRAQVVRVIGEARSQIELAAMQAPWREKEIAEARRKVEEADRQLGMSHLGAAHLFAMRAQRGASDLSAEARAVRQAKDVRRIGAHPTRLRSKASSKGEIVEILQPNMPVFPEERHGPWVLIRTTSGTVGWIPGSALDALPASPAPSR